MAAVSQVLAGGTRCIVLDSIGSTNAEALRLSRGDEGGPLWIVAREQTAGRGRRGRTWASPRGNLYATLLLTDPCRPERAPHLSFVAALALHDALSEILPRACAALQVKWPNDLILGGDKVAGILVEGESALGRRFVVAVGIGVNCISHPADTPYPATDLRAVGAEITPESLLPALANTMDVRLRQWSLGESFETIRADWTARAARLHESIRLRASDQDVEGRFDGVDQDGRLILTMRTGERKYFNAGEVTTGTVEIARLREGAAL
jgi:BirA family transcriptional regulator, biotin operon repressor / biotin---[acetyl-CoA-carboxylase] ligase